MLTTKIPDGLTMTAARTERNPNMPEADMDHWRVTLRYQGRRMSLVFSKGFGHKGAPPTTAEVLECLASDASLVENDGETYHTWADALGLDLDSRDGERNYRATVRQADRFRRLLGDAYATVVYPED